jgi:hypothetical protein
MRRKIGFALVACGVATAVGSYILRFPGWLAFNRYLVNVWELGVVLGLAVLSLGASMAMRSH